jgi:hypothetical protein
MCVTTAAEGIDDRSQSIQAVAVDADFEQLSRRPPRGAWRCANWLDPEHTHCARCGSDLDHPIDVCSRCEHLVVFHGRDTEGCGRIFAAGWCECRRSFGRAHAEYVRYW